MFKFFKKKKGDKKINQKPSFELELTATVLAYEIARSDGEISNSELSVLMQEIEKISKKVGKDKNEVFRLVEIYSKDSEDINLTYSKEEKISLLKFMWETAYADGMLDVDEERLVRRVADLIKIKDIEVLKLKDLTKNKT